MSTNAAVHMVLCRRDDAYSQCIDYVADLLARTCGWRFQTCRPEAAAAAARTVPQPRVLMTYLEAAPNQSLPAEPAGDWNATVTIPRGTFFGANFLSGPELPGEPRLLMNAGTLDGFRTQVRDTGSNSFVLGFDVLAAAFWFVTRYEEYILTTSDEHGRFLCAHSMAPPKMYDRPLVSEWFAHMKTVVTEKLGLSADGGHMARRAAFVLTHDVDLLRKYRGLKGARKAFYTAMQSTVSEATDEVRTASLVLAGIRRDPYDSFDDLFSLKEKLGAPSTFFLMGGGNSPYDGDYKLDDTPMRELVSRIKTSGDEIGVHPSYDSYLSEKTVAIEATAVAVANGKPVQGSRQHYLRFSVPQTWRALSSVGIRYDSSLSFADRAGFRCGWSGCFRPFDIEQRKVLPIIEVPLIVMDVTLALYEKLSAEHALERLAALLEASETSGGAFVLLWHNIVRDRRVFPGFWDTLEYFLFAAAGSTRFVTLSRLCDEFEQQ
jgi:hypothetical protein